MAARASVAILATIALWAVPVAAADWPAKPIRMIVPFAAGGAADITARLFSDALSVSFGQQFILENRTGAGGLIGAQAVARAEPDGYTLMGAGMSFFVNDTATTKNPGY